jgi:hypothetical protein
MGRSTKGRQDKYSVNFDLGTKDFKLMFDAITAKVERAIEAALNDLMEQAYELSQKYVPASTGPNRKYALPPDAGALKRSGAWEKARRDGRKFISRLTYGDDVVDYAWFVEMDMPSTDGDKNYSSDGTGAYYLSRSLNEVFTREAVISAVNKHMK